MQITIKIYKNITELPQGVAWNNYTDYARGHVVLPSNNHCCALSSFFHLFMPEWYFANYFNKWHFLANGNGEGGVSIGYANVWLLQPFT